MKRCRLSGAIGPDQCYDLAFVDVEGDAFDGMDCAVININILNGKYRTHYFSSFLSFPSSGFLATLELTVPIL